MSGCAAAGTAPGAASPAACKRIRITAVFSDCPETAHYPVWFRFAAIWAVDVFACFAYLAQPLKTALTFRTFKFINRHLPITP